MIGLVAQDAKKEDVQPFTQFVQKLVIFISFHVLFLFIQFKISCCIDEMN